MFRRQAIARASGGICLLAGAHGRAQSKPLQLGVLPHLSARLILTNYQPLRSHLEKELTRPVEISTAANFKEYQARSVAGDYDLMITAPNLARVAQLDAALPAMAICEPPIPGLLVMLKQRPVRQIEELRGKAVAAANPQSLVVLKGMHWLKARQLVVGQDFKLVRAANEDSLAQLLKSGDAPLAMMSMGEFRSIQGDLRNEIEIFSEFAKVPGFIILAKLGMPASQVETLRTTLLRLVDTDEGAQLKTLTGIAKIRPILDDDLRSLDDVADETRALMK